MRGTSEIDRYGYHEGGYLYFKESYHKSKIGKKVGHCRKTDGYWTMRFEGKTNYVHRIIWLWHHGYMPSEIDHIDRDKSNNRIENLREVSSFENHQNRTPGKGYSYIPSRNKWRVSIRGNFYGYYKTEKEAKHVATGAMKLFRPDL